MSPHHYIFMILHTVNIVKHLVQIHQRIIIFEVLFWYAMREVKHS